MIARTARQSTPPKTLLSLPSPRLCPSLPFSIAPHSKIDDREDYDPNYIIRSHQSASQLRKPVRLLPASSTARPCPLRSSPPNIDPLDESNREFHNNPAIPLSRPSHYPRLVPAPSLARFSFARIFSISSIASLKSDSSSTSCTRIPRSWNRRMSDSILSSIS